MAEHIPRRVLIRGIGVAATAGVLAGCADESDGGDGGEGGDGGDGSDGDGETTTAAATPTETEASDGGDGGVPSEVSDWLSDANNFDGSVIDATGEDGPTVDVGAGSGLAFGPAAIRISHGTTLTWEWTGNGGSHNVVHQDDEFRSGNPTGEEGNTFEHSFDSAGNYLYYCKPHQTAGMKGAVIVE